MCAKFRLIRLIVFYRRLLHYKIYMYIHVSLVIQIQGFGQNSYETKVTILKKHSLTCNFRYYGICEQWKDLLCVVVLWLLNVPVNSYGLVGTSLMASCLKMVMIDTSNKD